MPEAAAAAGLLAGLAIAPLGIAAGAGLAAFMAGALAFRLRVHDAIPFLSATPRCWRWPPPRPPCAP